MSAGATSSSSTTTNASPAITPVLKPNVEATLPDTFVAPEPGFYGVLVSVFMFVLTIFVLFSTGSLLAVLVLWATIALILTVLVYYGFLSIDKLLNKEIKEVKKVVAPEPKAPAMPSGAPMVGSEVFHISDAQFTYDEAPAVCAAYGAEMATLEQIMDAYAKGAEWCGYGWSAGGMALYPTQKSTWDQLQGEVDPGKRTRCGRPGVNGGYFDPSIKFGVNCYGFKPPGKFTPPAPVPGSDTAKFKETVNKFKEMLKSFSIDPYSRKEWSGHDSGVVNQTYAYGKKLVEGFAGQAMSGYGSQFKQDLGKLGTIREGLENADSRYVEAISGTNTASSASAVGGPYGLRGDVGPPGTAGAPGPVGAASTIPGPPGSIGPAGPAGAASTVPGPAGIQGIQGVAGPKGERGERGEQGLPGAGGTGGGIAGPKGDVGPAGPAGQKGEQGVAGVAGSAGPVGPVGPIGPGGPAGPAGPPSERDIILDTRMTNLTPTEYWAKGMGVYREFKLSSSIGVTGLDSYGYLETVVPWADSSGSPIQQTFTAGIEVYKRVSTTGAKGIVTWSPWVKKT